MVLAVAAGLRVLVMLAYPTAQVYWYDSFTYMDTAVHLRPSSEFHPAGYAMFLALFRPFHSVVLVAAVQHLMGLGIGLMMYAVLRRHSLPAWGAALATLPVLLNPAFMRLEHAILSDIGLIFLVVAALTVIMWRADVSVRAASLAGLLLACAGLTRTVAVPLLGLFVLYLVVRRAGLRVVLALTVAGALPLSAYGAWYAAHHGRFALSGSDGVALWARTMTFADCAVIKPPPEEAKLCPNGTKVDAASEYVWAEGASLNLLPGGRFAHNDLARAFALRAIRSQPLDYLGEVARDTSIVFAWPPVAHPKRVSPPALAFPRGPWTLPANPLIDKVKREYDSDIAPMHSAEPYIGILSAYRYPALLYGPLLALLLLIGAAGSAVRRRPALLPWTAAVFLLVAPVAALDFDHRYAMPVFPFACVAAALGVAALSKTLNKERDKERDKKRDKALNRTFDKKPKKALDKTLGKAVKGTRE